MRTKQVKLKVMNICILMLTYTNMTKVNLARSRDWNQSAFILKTIIWRFYKKSRYCRYLYLNAETWLHLIVHTPWVILLLISVTFSHWELTRAVNALQWNSHLLPICKFISFSLDRSEPCLRDTVGTFREYFKLPVISFASSSTPVPMTSPMILLRSNVTTMWMNMIHGTANIKRRQYGPWLITPWT